MRGYMQALLVALGVHVASGWRWVQVWSDEFDGGQIDRSKWKFDIGGGGWGNNELEYYTDRP